jgi:hypothetical protein
MRKCWTILIKLRCQVEGRKDSARKGRMKDKVEKVKVILKRKTNPDRAEPVQTFRYEFLSRLSVLLPFLFKHVNQLLVFLSELIFSLNTWVHKVPSVTHMCALKLYDLLHILTPIKIQFSCSLSLLLFCISHVSLLLNCVRTAVSVWRLEFVFFFICRRNFLFNNLQSLGADALYLSLNLRVIQVMSLLYSYSELFRCFHELLKCIFLSSLTLFNLVEKPEVECEGKARSSDTVECVSECINKWAASRVPASTRSICSRQAVGFHGNTGERKRRCILAIEREREELRSLTTFPRNSVAWPSRLAATAVATGEAKRGVCELRVAAT